MNKTIGFRKILTGVLVAGALIGGTLAAGTGAASAVPRSDDPASASRTAAAKTLTSSKPKISGVPKLGKTLKVRVGAWTDGTRFTYKWYRNGQVVKKATRSSYKLRSADLGAQIKVKVIGKKAGHKTKARTSNATRTITYPNRANPTSLYNCPSWAPIKGNGDSMIYHLPGQRWYKATQPEDCFRTEATAQKYGYRRAKV